MAQLIDLSHEIEHGMVTYRGLPSPTISDWLTRDASTTRYAPGTTFQIGKIELLANTGTYIDAPFHRYQEGRDIAGYALEAVADLPGIVVRVSGPARPIDRSAPFYYQGRGRVSRAGGSRTRGHRFAQYR